MRSSTLAFVALVSSTLAFKCGQEDPDLSLFEVPDGVLEITARTPGGDDVSGAVVRIDGEIDDPTGAAWGDAPIAVSLPPGRYTVSVDLEGYVATPTQRTVDVFGRATTVASFTLEPGEAVPALVDVVADLSTLRGDGIVGLPVWLDGAQTELVTPATLDVTPGNHVIALGDSLGLFLTSEPEVSVSAVRGETATATFTYEPGYRRVTIAEDFTNTSCDGCPEAEDVLIAEAERFPSDEVVTLHIHNRIPATSDPLWQANPLELSQRSAFYELLGNPTIIINGTTRWFQEPDPGEVAAALQSDADGSSPVYLEIRYSRSGSTITGETRVRAVSDVAGDHRLLVLSLQDEISYPTPPGTNGQTHFVRIVRDYVPDTNGQAITISAGMDETIPFSFDLIDSGNPPDDPDKLICVAFIQEFATRSIVQAASTIP